jgi:hypothetical protein
VPTSGTSKLKAADLNNSHLLRIANAIDKGDARFVFIPPGVAQWMRKFTLFPWLPGTPIDEGRHLKVWHRRPNKTIYWHYHFSHAFNGREKTAQLHEIGQLIAAL